MQRQYQIRIELLSDGCPSSGEVYNSIVDVEIDYDPFGFPFLSAKRIKGCLKETAFFMREWGMDIPIEEIFGGKGNTKGKLRLENAKLENYDSMRNEIESYKKTGIGHPQNVLKYFSYIRTQTAMENGVAKRTSLRVLRVLKKGLIFVANISIDEKYKKYMEDICKCTRNMGLNRTRGLGEIKISWIDENDKIKEEQGQSLSKNIKIEELPENYKLLKGKNLEDKKYYRLFYSLKLLEPVILKTVDKGQEKTEDYIQGAKMLGILAGRMGNKTYQQLTKEENIICSNLYITDFNIRHLPAPESMCYEKDRGIDKVYDLAAGYQTDMQIKGLHSKYIGQADIDKIKEKLSVLAVNTQIRYHHSRPEDKSIGRARGDGKGEMYQLSSLTEGQVFSGFIQGNTEQMKEIIEQFKEMKTFTIGYGTASEYGKVELYIDKFEECSVKQEELSEFLVYFVSPMIVYNDMGMYSYQVEDVKKEIIRYFKLKDRELEVEQEKIYLSYTIIGGWQTMWKKPKQITRVLDKGTVLTFRVKDGTSIHLPKESIFLGERVAEGYGEVKFLSIPKKKEWETVLLEHDVKSEIGSEKEMQIIKKQVNTEGEFIKELKKIEEKEILKKEGSKVAKELEEIEASVVNKLLLTLQEQKVEEEQKKRKKEDAKQSFFDVINFIKKESKKLQAEKIKQAINRMSSCIYIEEDEAFYVFTKALLLQLKYELRAEEGKKYE